MRGAFSGSPACVSKAGGEAMKKITIEDKRNGILGEALPDYGGMLTRLRYHGKEIIFFDEAVLHQSNILAGGCPVLFPFPSRTAGDSYRLGEKTYSMPFHGLVKSAQFGVQETAENSVTLYICLLYTSPSPRDRSVSRMPSSA